jgi:hypoxanthine phosphoribosyltransferase
MDYLSPFLTRQQVQSIVSKLGQQISDDYGRLLQSGESLEVIVTLKGSFMFAADLVRSLTVPLQIDFIRLASYGASTQSSGTVKQVTEISMPREGAHILVLDEIVDSGRTLAYLVEKLSSCRPKSLKVCSLLNKPSRREVEIKVDYVGMDIEDKFVVGYGLDFNELYRNLSEICILEQR